MQALKMSCNHENVSKGRRKEIYFAYQHQLDTETGNNGNTDFSTVGTAQDVIQFQFNHKLDLFDGNFEDRLNLGNDLKNDLDLDSDLEGGFSGVRYHLTTTTRSTHRAHRCGA